MFGLQIKPPSRHPLPNPFNQQPGPWCPKPPVGEVSLLKSTAKPAPEFCPWKSKGFVERGCSGTQVASLGEQGISRRSFLRPGAGIRKKKHQRIIAFMFVTLEFLEAEGQEDQDVRWYGNGNPGLVTLSVGHPQRILHFWGRHDPNSDASEVTMDFGGFTWGYLKRTTPNIGRTTPKIGGCHFGFPFSQPQKMGIPRQGTCV